jgi:hypothetical protein
MKSPSRLCRGHISGVKGVCVNHRCTFDLRADGYEIVNSSFVFAKSIQDQIFNIPLLELEEYWS